MSAELPKLPPIDQTRMLPYSAIRYVPGYPEQYVQEYAKAYAQEATRQAMEKKERAERNRDMWKAQCEEQARRLEALHIGIAEHNADCIGQCEARKKIGKTSCYMLGYDRECGDCPRDGMVNLPEPPPTSGNGEGGGNG